VNREGGAADGSVRGGPLVFLGLFLNSFRTFSWGDKKVKVVNDGICATDISVVKRLLGCMSLGRGGGEVLDSCCILSHFSSLAYSDSTRPTAAAQGERFGRHAYGIR
jgi:hypothetical protein